MDSLNAAIVRYVPPEDRAEMQQYLVHIMHAESRGKTAAKNTESSATGLFQFTKATWKGYGNGRNIYDADAQCDAVVRFALDNAKCLRKTLGREPTAGEYYLAHFAGPSRASAILKADNDTPIKQLLDADAVHSNRDIKFDGKLFGRFTARDIKCWANKKMDMPADANGYYEPASTDFATVLMEMLADMVKGMFAAISSAFSPADQNTVDAPKFPGKISQSKTAAIV